MGFPAERAEGPRRNAERLDRHMAKYSAPEAPFPFPFPVPFPFPFLVRQPRREASAAKMYMAFDQPSGVLGLGSLVPA